MWRSWVGVSGWPSRPRKPEVPSRSVNLLQEPGQMCEACGCEAAGEEGEGAITQQGDARRREHGLLSTPKEAGRPALAEGAKPYRRSIFALHEKQHWANDATGRRGNATWKLFVKHTQPWEVHPMLPNTASPLPLNLCPKAPLPAEKLPISTEQEGCLA